MVAACNLQAGMGTRFSDLTGNIRAVFVRFNREFSGEMLPFFGCGSEQEKIEINNYQD